MRTIQFVFLVVLLVGCASSQPPRDCAKECAEAVALDQEANNVLKAELGKMRALTTKARADLRRGHGHGLYRSALWWG